MNKYVRAALVMPIVVACAIPSLIWSDQLNPAARWIGIAIFAVVSAWVARTKGFDDEWHVHKNFRVAVTIGYGLRLLVSVVFPIGMAIDVIPGMISAGISGLNISGHSPREAAFGPVLFATLFQGALLHIMLWLFIGVVFLVVRAVNRKRQMQPHGFAVIMPAASNALPISEGNLR